MSSILFPYTRERGTFMPRTDFGFTDLDHEAFNRYALQQLEGLKARGVIDYLLPSEPLGEKWVIGYESKSIKLNNRSEVEAFLAGVLIAVTNFTLTRLRDKR